MKSYSSEIEIDATIEHVWPILADVENWPDWAESFTTVALLNHGEAGLGVQVRIKQPKLAANIWTITDWQPQASFIWKTSSFGTAIAGDHQLHRKGNGCIFYQRLDFSGPIGKLSAMLGAGLIKRYMRMEAEGLKRAGEASAAD